MGKFEIKEYTAINSKNPVSVYISCSTDTINPFEIEKDIKNFIAFMNEKYEIKTTNSSFKEWVTNKFKK